MLDVNDCRFIGETEARCNEERREDRLFSLIVEARLVSDDVLVRKTRLISVDVRFIRLISL